MKNTAAIILFFFLTLFAYTKLVGPIPFSVTSTTTTKTRQNSYQPASFTRYCRHKRRSHVTGRYRQSGTKSAQ